MNSENIIKKKKLININIKLYKYKVIFIFK